MTQAQPLFVQTPGVTYEAADFRGILDTLFTEGVKDVQGGQLLVTALNDGTLRVAVAAGTAYVKGDDVPATQGLYVLRAPAGENVTVTAPPPSGSRIDVLVYEEIDADLVALAGRPAGARFRAVPGPVVTTGTPVPATVPNTAIPLASFPVAAGQSTIPAGSITDLRVQAGAATLKVGTQAQPLTATQIAALATAERFAGRLIENTTTGKLQHVTAAGAAPVDVSPTPPAAAGTIIDTTTSQAVGATLTRRMAVPAGAARGVIGIRGTGQNTGGFVYFTTTAAGAFAGYIGTSAVFNVRHRSIDTTLVDNAAAQGVTLTDAYIDTGTSELVLIFSNVSGNVRTYFLYATYEVF